MSRQIQAISNRANLCSDVERAKETKGKLLVGSRSKRGLNIRLQLQEDLIPSLKAAFRTMLIYLFFHSELGTI
jgi:hypothetical protein